MYREQVISLCELETDLTREDMEKIIEVSKSIEYISSLQNCDVFIDVLSKFRDEAIVICEVRHIERSLYKESVIGKKALRHKEPAVLRTLQTAVKSKDVQAITQENKWVKQTVVPIKNGEKVVAVLITEVDISDKIRNEKKIKSLRYENKNLTKTLIGLVKDTFDIRDFIKDGVVVFDSSGKVLRSNQSAKNIYKKLGFIDDIVGDWYDNLSLDGTEFKTLTKETPAYLIEVNEVHIGEYYLLVKKLLTDLNYEKVIVIIEDITQIKMKEEEIISKSVAIKEIHHRVKNNLQTIASLLRIQSRRCTEDETKTILLESVNRILSISSTHELLSKQIEDNISILEVIRCIKTFMERCFNFSEKSIDIEVLGDDFKIDSDRATSFALILNELLQNSLDHAFKNKDRGNISINLKTMDEFKIITVEDDGVGYNVSKGTNDSLGLKIVELYVKDKIKGKLKVFSDENGTKTEIIFKL